jgi:hypothetical protein
MSYDRNFQAHLILLKQDGLYIRNIKNPCLELQLEAVKENGFAIKYLLEPPVKYMVETITPDQKPPCLEVQLTAVRKFGEAIKYINNPCYAVQLEAVKQNGCAIGQIPHPTVELQIIAVQQSSYAIRCVLRTEDGQQHNQHSNMIDCPCVMPCLEVQLALVKTSPLTIKYLRNPCVEVQLEAVTKNGMAIEYINNPSIEVQAKALENSIPAMQYVTDVHVLHITKRNYFDTTTDGLTLLSYTRNIEAIIYFLLNQGVEHYRQDYIYDIIIRREATRVIMLAMRKCKWYRLARLVRSKVFCEWYYAPENTGGLLLKKLILKSVNHESYLSQYEGSKLLAT